MKNPIFVLRVTILSICLGAFIGDTWAQTDSNQSKDYDFENWRVLFQMNGPNNWNASLNFVKPIKPKWALRFGLSPTISYSRTKGDSNEPDVYVFYDDISKTKRFGAKFSLGAEFHFLQKSKIDPYVLMGSGLGMFAERTDRFRNYEYQEVAPNDLLEYESNSINKGAPRISISPFAGFGVNYFFNSRMAIGAEYSLSPNMILVKGNTNQKATIIRTYENGAVETTTNDSESKSNAFYLDFVQQVGVHFIYVLNNGDK